MPGKSGAKGAKVHKLSSNESPIGASAKAIAAYKAAADTLELYPDGAATALRTAIASRYGLLAENIVCGAGSDELLQLLAHAYLGPGDEAIYSQYGFLVYPIAIQSNGATPVVAPENGLSCRCRCHSRAGDGAGPAWCSSPIPTIRRAAIFPSAR